MQNNSLSLLMLASAMGSLFLSLYIFTRRKYPAMFNLSLLLMAVTIWALGYSLELASTNLQTMKVFTTFAYLGVATIPVLWLIFVARYTGNDGWLTPLKTAFLFIVPAISIILVATNDQHYLFYSLYEIDYFGGISFSSTEPGLFWWIHVTYSYLAIITGLWLLISLYFKVPQSNRFLVGLFIAGLLLPYAANIAYVSGFKPYGFLDITPIAFIIMGLLLSFGAFTKRAIDVSPLAYDLLFQNIPDIIFVIDMQGRIVNTNPAAKKLLDYEINHDSTGDNKQQNPLFNNQNLSELADASEVALNEKTYTISNTSILSPGNKPLGKLITLHDITARNNTQVELERRLELEKVVSKISAIFVGLPSAEINEGINQAIEITGRLLEADHSYILLFTEDGTHFDVTNEWCVTGIPPQKERYKNFPVVKIPWWIEKTCNSPYLYIEDTETLPAAAAIDKEEFKLRKIQSVLSIPLRSEGKVIGILGYDKVKRKSMLDVNQIYLLTVISELVSNAITRQQAEEKILYMSFHDQLTGLYNRHYLKEEMQRLDTERQLPISIIMADLNGLKLINDTYGHSTGDEMLKRTAAILKEVCRKEDILARYGGDEFVLYLPRTREEDAQAISRRIILAFNNERIKDLPVTISIGMAVKTDAEQNINTVLSESEDKMYQHKLTESSSGKSAVLDALLKTLAAKSYETEVHTRNMQEVAIKIGEKIGLPDSELHRLSLLITLHDIGKINIPEELLLKSVPLSEEEWVTMKRHCETGFRIARATEAFAHVAEDILAHHERWDGKGYPQGLKGGAIPLLARITAIADAFEVMSNGRPYKKAMSKDEIVAEFKNCAGTHFDPELAKMFLSILQTNR